CTRMAEAGMDQRTLQEIMGHSNLAITMKVYNHVDDKRMHDEIEKFDEKRSRDSRASGHIAG
ncbi:MAG: phage integrase family protein, partial [Lachnospiraceae bacterium]|nr:phage integrase family protein [Lachnospiraceae bacterium]